MRWWAKYRRFRQQRDKDFERESGTDIAEGARPVLQQCPCVKSHVQPPSRENDRPLLCPGTGTLRSCGRYAQPFIGIAKPALPHGHSLRNLTSLAFVGLFSM